MLLTDEQIAEADRLKLTYTEMSVALKTHLDPEVYARHKAELQAARDAWEQTLNGMSDAMLERAAYFAPHVRGKRPDLEPPTNEEAP